MNFLICDDCSTDKSLSVINAYSDERIILLENKVNKGYIETLNSLIKISKGKYVARQDNDDVSVSSRLRIQFNFMELNLDHAMCGGKINTFGKKNKINFVPVNHEEISSYFLFRNPFNHPTVFIRRKILNNKIKYNKNFFLQKIMSFGLKYLKKIWWLILMKYYYFTEFTKKTQVKYTKIYN